MEKISLPFPLRLPVPIYFLLSFLIVASAQPDWSVVGCILASSLGYALFWHGVCSISSTKSRFWIAVFWFGGISAFHLNWFFSDRYVGIYIYPFLGFLCLWLGAQFALVTLLIGNPKELSGLKILGISGCLVLLEWSRLFILSGYSLDPIGIALSGTLLGMQMASVLGVFGLSFWICFTNLIALRFFSDPSRRLGLIFGAVALFPYLSGGAHLAYHTHQMAHHTSEPLKTLLVQTALAPEDKVPINGSMPLSPASQWRAILSLLAPYLAQPLDMIVLPEGTVPYGTHHPIYFSWEIERAFREILGRQIQLTASQGRLGNGAWVQALADVTGAEVIVGLEDVDIYPEEKTMKAYNAALLAHPFATTLSRYEKRVLVPMGEYIPFHWCKKILSKYGISDSFTPGREAKVFSIAQSKAGVSICYEETYGYLMRQYRQKGADMLINLTNDVWYPNSRLPVVHFFHGRLRAVELGVPILRACNTGVTCGLDALGNIVGELPFENANSSAPQAVLSLVLPLYHLPTVYALWGDAFLVGFSFIVFAAFLISKCFNRKRFKLKGFYIYLLRKN